MSLRPQDRAFALSLACEAIPDCEMFSFAFTLTVPSQ